MTGLGPDEQRLAELLERPEVPAEIKRQAVDAYRAMQAQTTTTPTSPQPFTSFLTDRPQVQAYGALGATALVSPTAATPLGPFAIPAAGVLGHTIAGQAYDLAQSLRGRATPENQAPVAQLGRDIRSGVTAEAAGLGINAVTGPLISHIVNSRAAKAAARLAKIRQFRQHQMPYLPSDISEGAAVPIIERAVGTPAPGAAIKGSVRSAQLARAGEIAEEQFGARGTQSTLMGIGLRVQRAVRQHMDTWKATQGRIFDQIEADAGLEPVVSTGPIREALQTITQRRQNTAAGIGAYTKATEAGLDTAGVGDLGLETALNPSGRAILRIVQTEERIPFSLARELESQLGELQRATPDQYVRGLRKGEYAHLYGGVRQAISAFMDEASTGLGPRLAEAKQAWRTGHALAENLGGLVQGRQAERIVSTIVKPNNLEDILDLKLAVDPETWQAITTEWKAQLVRNNTVRQRTADGVDRLVPSPTKLAKAIDAYDLAGTLDVLLDPSEAAAARETAQMFRQMGAAERDWMNTSRSGGTAVDVGTATSVGTALFTGRPGLAAKIGAGYLMPSTLGMGFGRLFPEAAAAAPGAPAALIPMMFDPRVVRGALHAGTAQRERRR